MMGKFIRRGDKVPHSVYDFADFTQCHV